MSATVRVVVGPARSGKTTLLVDQYEKLAAGGPIARAMWLSPTQRTRNDVRQRLIDKRPQGLLGGNLLTFPQLAARLLAACPVRLRPLSATQVRALVREVIARQLASGDLAYFAPIANTPGFVSLVMAFVQELKRLEIWPQELAAALSRHSGPKDRELHRLYAAYQELLEGHDLYDAEGQFWAARAQLRDGRFGPLEAVRHVFVDGFTDFTRTEQEVIDLFARRAESLWITLPLDPEGCRDELFTKPRATLAALRARYAGAELVRLAPRPLPAPALAHLERHVFDHPRNVVPLADPGGVEILAAAGTTHEAELIADRIKGLLAGREGPRVSPGEILVVFRSLADAAPLVSEVFARYGIPCTVASQPPLAAAPVVAALAAWLRLDVEDWPFRQVLALLAHNYFRPLWPEWRDGRAAVALERLAREFSFPARRADLVAGVDHARAQAERAAADKQRLRRCHLDAQLAAPLLARMVALLDALPERAAPGAWAQAIARLADEAGLLRAAGGNPLGADAANVDRQGWLRLMAALAERERLARWTGAAPPQWSRRELLAELEDLLRYDALPLANDETGTVRVLSAERARNLSAPYVFLAGLSEKSFPAQHRDDCLHGDAQRLRLTQAGLPLPTLADRHRFEMLLFYEVVTRATRHLVLSYPALDPAAQPLVPSPYLRDVEHACGGPDRLPRNAHPHLSSVPASDDVRSRRDLRVRAVSRALSGEAGLLARWRQLGEAKSPGGAGAALRETVAGTIAGLRLTAARSRRGEPFGPFEGMLDSPAAARELAGRFGPERSWTPSQLEQYAYCPFQYFLASVLRVEQLPEPELAIDYQGRGQMLHWLLSEAHRRLNALEGRPSSPHGAESFLALVEELADELRELHGRGAALDSGLAEIDIRQVRLWIDRYRRQHALYDRQWASWELPPRPAHFEVAFGPRRDRDLDDEVERALDQCDPLSTHEAYELSCAGETVRFSGRIDRIDVGRYAGQTVFCIVDYKSGAVRKSTRLQAVLEGQSLQLPLYSLAARWLLAGQQAQPFRAAYWHVAKEGYQDKEAVKFLDVADDGFEHSEQWRELEAALGPRVRSLIEGIRRGEFPVYSSDEKCTTYCSYKTVCRVHQTRWLEKAWQPPIVEGP